MVLPPSKRHLGWHIREHEGIEARACWKTAEHGDFTERFTVGSRRNAQGICSTEFVQDT